MACDLSSPRGKGNIAAVMRTFEVDSRHRFVGASARIIYRRTQRRDGENAPTRGDHFPVIDARAGMKNVHIA
jgi:hypothetical protein